MMPMSITMVFATTFSGGFMTKTGKYKGLAIIGLAIGAVGIFLMSYITINTSVALIILYLCIVGIGLGLSMPVFSLTVQNAVSLRQLGVASASSQLFRSLGNTVGIGIFGAVMSSVMVKKMTSAFSGQTDGGLSNLPPEEAGKIGQLMNPEILLDTPRLEQVKASIPADIQPIAEQLVGTVKGVFSEALTTTFFVAACIMVAGAIVAVFLRAIPLVSANDSSNAKIENKK